MLNVLIVFGEIVVRDIADHLSDLFACDLREPLLDLFDQIGQIRVVGVVERFSGDLVQ